MQEVLLDLGSSSWIPIKTTGLCAIHRVPGCTWSSVNVMEHLESSYRLIDIQNAFTSVESPFLAQSQIHLLKSFPSMGPTVLRQWRNITAYSSKIRFNRKGWIGHTEIENVCDDLGIISLFDFVWIHDLISVQMIHL